MAEIKHEFTPYHYCLNNPLSNIDPTGMYSYNWNTGNYENNNGDIVSWNEVKGNNFEEPPGNAKSSYANFPTSVNDIIKGFVDYFGWGLDPKDPKNRDKIEQGDRNVEAATNAINNVNKFIIVNGALIVVSGGGGFIVDEVAGAIILRAISPEAVAIAESSESAMVGRVFWSGGKEAMKAAADYAMTSGKITLEMTRAGQNLAKLTEGMPWEEARPMWARLSSVFAKGAKGTADFFPGAKVSPTSIWAEFEQVILEANKVIITTH